MKLTVDVKKINEYIYVCSKVRLFRYFNTYKLLLFECFSVKMRILKENKHIFQYPYQRADYRSNNCLLHIEMQRIRAQIQ